MQRIFSTVLSQYSTAPTLTQIVRNLNDAVDPQDLIDEFHQKEWNVLTAEGYGLDVWGRIVAVGRVFQVSVDTFFGFEEATLSYGPFGRARFYGGGEVNSNFRLDDEGYRTLILAKAYANISDGSIPSLTRIMRMLFDPDGTRGDGCYAADNGDMTISLVFNFHLTLLERAIIAQSGAFPKPAGVELNIVESNVLRGLASFHGTVGMRAVAREPARIPAFAMTFGMTAHGIRNPNTTAFGVHFGLTAVGRLRVQGRAAFNQSGLLTARPIERLRAAPGTMAVAGSLSARTTARRRAIAAFAGAGALTARGNYRRSGAAAFSGAGFIAPPPTTKAGGKQGSAALAGALGLSAATTARRLALAAFALGGSLTAQSTLRRRAVAAFGGGGNFVADGTVITVGLDAKVIYLTAPTSSWTVPSDFVSGTSIELIGAGGDGAPVSAVTQGWGGGQGGGYARWTSISNITAGDVLVVQIPAHGSTLPTQIRDNTGAVRAQADYGISGLGRYGGGNASNPHAQVNIGDVTFVGGQGGTTSATASYGGAGGGGAGGPTAAGAAGGNGAQYMSGGGGGADGGAAAANATNTVPSAGGNNSAGSGGGAAGTSVAKNGAAGTAVNSRGGAGGGGAYGQGSNPGNGGDGAIGREWDSTHGSGGGGGGGGGTGGGGTTSNGGDGGLFGGGGGGAGNKGSLVSGVSGLGGDALIVISYIGHGAGPQTYIGGAAFAGAFGLSTRGAVRMQARAALAGTGTIVADGAKVAGGPQVVTAIMLNNSTGPLSVSLPVANAGLVIAPVTVTTQSGLPYTGTLSITGPDANSFALTNGGVMPGTVSLIVGPTNLTARAYSITINAP